MEIILLERIRRLGQMGEVVVVKDGFARNFLIPSGKALRANARNKAHFETQRADLEARNLEEKGEASKVGEKIDGQVFVSIRQAGDTGQLYGSVSSRDIAEVVTENGIAINRNQVLLNRPIKVLGLHKVVISLHPEVEIDIEINVARSTEEAVLQAAGEDINALRDADDDAEDALSAEEIFEEGAEPSEDDASEDGADEAGASDEVSEEATEDKE